MPLHQHKLRTRDQFEGLYIGSRPLLKRRQQCNGRGWIGHAHPRMCGVGCGRMQPQHRPRDDAQRALRPDEQVPQHVAGVVFLQRGEIDQHAPIGQHHFKTGDEVTHRPVAHDGGAAGIGRDQPADLGTSLAAKLQRELATDLRGRFMKVAKNDTSIHGHQIGRLVDLADAVHPAQRKHDAALPLHPAQRHRPKAQARIAAHREYWLATLAAQAHHRRDLLGRGRRNHRDCITLPTATPVGEPGRHFRWIGNYALLANDGLKR